MRHNVEAWPWQLVQQPQVLFTRAERKARCGRVWRKAPRTVVLRRGLLHCVSLEPGVTVPPRNEGLKTTAATVHIFTVGGEVFSLLTVSNIGFP